VVKNPSYLVVFEVKSAVKTLIPTGLHLGSWITTSRYLSALDVEFSAWSDEFSERGTGVFHNDKAFAVCFSVNSRRVNRFFTVGHKLLRVLQSDRIEDVLILQINLQDWPSLQNYKSIHCLFKEGRSPIEECLPDDLSLRNVLLLQLEWILTLDYSYRSRIHIFSRWWDSILCWFWFQMFNFGVCK